MEPKETHIKIEELLSAAYDGEVSLEEHAQAEEALNSPEWASHAAFLGILKDSARFDPIEVPASLSERIALATYAKPTLWSRITGALRPAPMRYAAGGLALSGLAAISLVMLRPPVVPNIQKAPVASPEAAQVAIDPKPTPDVQPITPQPSPDPLPQNVLPTPKPELPKTPEIIRTPAPIIANLKNDKVRPPVTQGPTTVADASRNQDKIELPITPKAKPTPGPIKKTLAPARIAEPTADIAPVPVPEETPRPIAVATGDTTPITEVAPDVIAPRPVTSASITRGAAHEGEPSNATNTQPAKPDGVMKISVNSGREKFTALSARPGVGGTASSRMSVVTDNEKP